MIELNYDKVPGLIMDESFREKIKNAMIKSSRRHAEEIKEMREKGEEITRGDFEIRADLMIMRCEYLIAEQIADGFKEAEHGEQMAFLHKYRAYLFVVLQRVITLETVNELIRKTRIQKS